MKSCSLALSRHALAWPAAMVLAAAALVAAPAVHGQNSLTNFSIAGADDTAPAPPKPVGSLDLTAIDKTADPCTDFYQ
jgi:putative endopeptidase